MLCLCFYCKAKNDYDYINQESKIELALEQQQEKS